jgi:hypothetical protein
MSEHEFEAVRGVPGELPEGETVLWQGSPHWAYLALDAFKVGWISGYFVLLLAWRFIESLTKGIDPGASFSNALAVLPLAAVAIGLLFGLAWVNSRSTVYTVTNNRVIMRFGAALTKAINIPFKIVESASSNARSNGRGDVAMKLVAPNKIPMLLLWPHMRPGTMRNPEPTFRSLKDAVVCAQTLSEALRIAHDQPQAMAKVAKIFDDAPVAAQQQVLA